MLEAGHEARSTLSDGTTLPNDVCLNVWPTAGGGEALQLWVKKQPGGAVAVFLLNNHQSISYTNVHITLDEVGLGGSVRLVSRSHALSLSLSLFPSLSLSYSALFTLCCILFSLPSLFQPHGAAPRLGSVYCPGLLPKIFWLKPFL